MLLDNDFKQSQHFYYFYQWIEHKTCRH